MDKLFEALKGIDTDKNYLLAVSGGVDSMVLLHLFTAHSLNFSVVHCNFHLRGEDSDKDEQLVQDYCKRNNIKLFTRSFDTPDLKKNRESVEMLARRLRYDFFKELLETHSFNYLVTAHHLNDNVETFFINLLRGSGLKGLSGMQIFNNSVFRPLLSFSRKEIIEFAQKNKIIWREDKTNHEANYLRNKIRHQVIPKLEDINPAFLYQAEKSMKIMENSYRFIEKEIEKLRERILLSKDKDHSIYSFEELKKSDFILAYHFLSYFGFTFEQDCENILTARTGSMFQSKTHTLWINRNEIIIKVSELSELSELSEKIESLPFEIDSPLKLKIFSSENKEKKEKTEEVVDQDKITFPLTLRKWKEGDYFYPINGNGRKKVSKFLKDEKVSNYDKEKVYVLCDNQDNIIWIIGFRLDNRFKISVETKKFMHFLI